MRLKLIIATADSDYAEHLSNELAERHAELFDVSVCSSAERLKDLLAVNKYDAALLEPAFATAAGLSAVTLPLALIGESGEAPENLSGMKKIRKYQRISSMAGNVPESYAETGKGMDQFGGDKGRVTAVWSPAGGTGKTTVALAYAARKASDGSKAAYLNLENFSSVRAYFHDNGKSISKAFEKLESNLEMALLGIRQLDGGSGVYYFDSPENYDDINILSAEEVKALVVACAGIADEVVVDMSSQCDARTRQIFDLASTILVVGDASTAFAVKWKQFTGQHNVFRQVQDKIVLVNNKNAKNAGEGARNVVDLPLLQTKDPVSVFKSLSGGNINW